MADDQTPERRMPPHLPERSREVRFNRLPFESSSNLPFDSSSFDDGSAARIAAERQRNFHAVHPTGVIEPPAPPTAETAPEPRIQATAEGAFKDSEIVHSPPPHGIGYPPTFNTAAGALSDSMTALSVEPLASPIPTVNLAPPTLFPVEVAAQSARRNSAPPIVRNRKEVLRYSRLLIDVLQEALDYDPQRQHNLPRPDLRINDDPAYLQAFAA